MNELFVFEASSYAGLMYLLVNLVFCFVEILMALSSVIVWFVLTEELDLHISLTELFSGSVEEMAWMQMSTMHRYSEKGGASCALLATSAAVLIAGMISSIIPFSYELNLTWEFFAPIIAGVYSAMVMSRLGWGIFVKSFNSRRYPFVSFLMFPIFSLGVAMRPFLYVFRFGLNINVGSAMLTGAAGVFAGIQLMNSEVFASEKYCWFLIGVGVGIYELLVVVVQVAVIVMLGSVYFQGTPAKWSLFSNS